MVTSPRCRKLIVWASSLLLATLVATAGWANELEKSIRCRGKLIYADGAERAHMLEVLKKCGEPSVSTGYVWMYEQGSMVRILEFDVRSRLIRIESERR